VKALGIMKRIISSWGTRMTAEDLAFIDFYLDEPGKFLFWQMSKIDRQHALTVARAVLTKSTTAAEKIDLKKLVTAALLHDIGKVGIPKEILGKDCGLTSFEWEVMQRHSEIGFRMAQSIDESVVAEGILALREHWDGTGYPRGLKGEQIPLLSRLVGLVDAFDVITHDRPYRLARSQEDGIRELEEGSGKQFDPHLTKLLITKLLS